MNASTMSNGAPRAARTPNLVPEGTYLAKCIARAFDTAKTKNKMFKASFRIADGEQRGRTVPFSMTFTADTLDMVKRVLGALGVDATREGWTRLPVEAYGNVVSITVEHEEGENRDGEKVTYARVKFVNALVQAFDPLSDDQLVALERKVRRGLGVNENTGPEPSPDMLDDGGHDEIPF